MRTSDIPEGFNQWTIPWTEPEGPELNALCAGTLELPEFELDVEAGEGLPV